MNRKLLYVGLLLILVVGIGSYYVVRINEPPRPPNTVNGYPAWHGDSKLPWEFDPAQASYRNPGLERALLFVDLAARRLSSESGSEIPPAKYPLLRTSGTLQQRYKRVYYSRWQAERHRIRIELELYEDDPRLAGFTLSVDHVSRDGWVVRWHGRITGAPPQFYMDSCTIWHPDLVQTGDGQPLALSLLPGTQRFSFREYWQPVFQVSSNWLEITNETLRQALVPEILARAWQSAPDFESAALEELNSFDRAIAHWFREAADMERLEHFSES